MATRVTQLRILQAALELFNAEGTAPVSASRIAERCGISKGNLQYHFPNKRDVILTIFQLAIGEMNAGWYRDHLEPTLEHMAAMFVRQLQLIVKYRFFYRELPDLLRQDPLLRRRYSENRERRLKVIEQFMQALAARALMRLPHDAGRLRSIVEVTWILSENWVNYIEYQDREMSATTILEGYAAILEVLRPYLCADPRQITEESSYTIERLVPRPVTPAAYDAAVTMIQEVQPGRPGSRPRPRAGFVPS
ncbi:MAG TPA: TetR/AcrR family transcriptional regulator [Steroidobacteraceae bacterium]|nr:TetR/AcrR family transcriptional regulator [Steroidobacteraceae bacterium]